MKLAEFEAKHGKYFPKQPQVVRFLDFFKEPLTLAEAQARINEEMARKQAYFDSLAQQPIGSLTVGQRSALDGYQHLHAKRAERQQIFAPSRRQ